MTEKIVSRVYRPSAGCCQACVWGKGPHSESCEFIKGLEKESKRVDGQPNWPINVSRGRSKSVLVPEAQPDKTTQPGPSNDQEKPLQVWIDDESDDWPIEDLCNPYWLEDYFP